MVDIFKNVCANNHYKFKNVSLPMLMMHAGIAIERIRNKNYLYETQSHCTGIDLEYHVSKDFFEELSQKFGIPYVEEEVVKFAFLLEGRGSRDRDNILTKHISWIKIIDNSKKIFMAMKGIST